jgi:hypothetical protein
VNTIAIPALNARVETIRLIADTLALEPLDVVIANRE